MNIKNKYNTFPPEISREEAMELLSTLSKDIQYMEDAEKRAVVWAIEHIGLTMQETANALGYSSKSWIHTIYHSTRRESDLS